MGSSGSRPYARSPEDTIRLLEQELADTNHEVLVLTLELEKRVEERTLELRVTQEELQRANSDLLALTAELENRVAERTRDLAQANAKLQAQLSRLNLLHRITRAIGERQDLESIFHVVTQSVEDDLPVDFVCVCLRDRAAGAITLSVAGTRSEAAAAAIGLTGKGTVLIEQNGLGRALEGQLVYEPDVNQLESPFARHAADAGLGALVLAPLPVEGKVFGVLIAARRAAQSFSSGDCEFLRQLSEHVSLAVHQNQLYDSLLQAYDDLRRTQDAVTQQERLRALGQLASGIAHDINNSISPVALYVESLLEREPGLSESAREYLLTIQQAIDESAAR